MRCAGEQGSGETVENPGLELISGTASVASRGESDSVSQSYWAVTQVPNATFQT